MAGEKKESTEKKGKDFYQTESRYGAFRRSIPLPDSVDQEKVEADYANGVLTIRLKKIQACPPKKVEVKIKGGPEAMPGISAPTALSCVIERTISSYKGASSCWRLRAAL